MAIQATCAGIRVDGQGRVYLAFGDGIVLEFGSRAQAIAWAGGLDGLQDEALTLLRRLLMAWWLKQDPGAATPALVIGKTITFNLAGTPILSVG